MTRWRAADIAGRIERQLGVKYTVEGVRRLLRQLGFRHVSARPVHPQSDEKKQEAFQAQFTEPVNEAVGKEDRGQQMEIWF